MKTEATTSAGRLPHVGQCALLGLAMLAMAASAARADGRDMRAQICAGMGEGFRPIVGAEGCFKVGGHVRVDSGVMRGAGRLSSYTDNGPMPAGLPYGPAAQSPFGARLRAVPR